MGVRIKLIMDHKNAAFNSPWNYICKMREKNICKNEWLGENQ